MESKPQRVFLDVREDRGEPSGYFVRSDLKDTIEEFEMETDQKVIGLIYDGTYNIELIIKNK